MSVKTTLPISEARKNIFKIIGETKRPGIYYTITDKGRPASVIMSAEEFESWQETLEVMRDFPDLDKEIKETENDYKSGKYKEWTTLRDIFNDEDFLKNKKSSKKNEISIKNKAKCRKGVKKVIR
jgi:prevent-host-death family protein